MVRYLKQAEPQSRQSNRELVARVRAMLDEIEQYRDDAVKRYAAQLDRWTKPTFRVSDEEIGAVRRTMSPVFKEDFAFCKKQVTDFAKRQRESLHEFEESFGAGITLGQKIIPVETVGCYIPGGKYPLISAAIMSVATAKVAGVPHVIGAAPPRDGEAMYAPTLYALAESGADEIYTIGGVQAFASMAYGCVGMKAVDMITGPGNAYVAEAKRQLFGLVGIDLPAGPTEILILADESADPSLVATDLLGQAEHGPDSPAWLITTSEKFGREVLNEIERQLLTLPTADVAGAAWQALGRGRGGRGRRCRDRPVGRVRAGAPGGADAAQRLLSVPASVTTAACSSARKAPSLTATRGSARTTRCRPDAPRATPAGFGSGSS